MEKIFMIQRGMISQEDFLTLVSKYSSIPKNLLEDKFNDDYQIIVREHYFRNIWNNLLKNEFNSYEELLNGLKNNNQLVLEKIEKLTDNKLELFYYEII